MLKLKFDKYDQINLIINHDIILLLDPLIKVISGKNWIEINRDFGFRKEIFNFIEN